MSEKFNLAIYHIGETDQILEKNTQTKIKG